MQHYNVIIIGAGAAGLLCAAEAGRRKRSVKVLDHANKPGKKILMSGGGRCNFTNYYIDPEKYASHNPHFFISALTRYTQWDFIDLVQRYRIPFHEKTLGQLFCDNKAKDIVDMLLQEIEKAHVAINLSTSINQVEKTDNDLFVISSSQGRFTCNSLVIASGGLSIPTMGASPFAYKIAEQFGINVWPTRAGLVPFTLDVQEKERYAPLAGIGLDTITSNPLIAFREHSLFTHRGLSGPAMLQLSSYWQPGELISVNLLPEHNLLELLKEGRRTMATKQLNTFLSLYLAKRVVDTFIPKTLSEKTLATLSNNDCEQIADLIHLWQVKPNGTEGYRTAEVTIGGVDCNELSSKTMEANKVAGLYFIGEGVDVTGWLGGYNFQWAWSSGWAAGQVV